MRRTRIVLRVFVRLFATVCALGSAALPAQAVLTVNTLGEPAGGINSANCAAACTLRDAFNSAASGDTIRFAPQLDGQAITLTLFGNNVSAGSKEFGPSAFFLDNKTLTIDAAFGLARGVTVQRDTNGAEFRLFDVGVGGDLTLRGLTLQNGIAHGGGSAVGGAALGAGGAVFNQGTLTVDRCTLANNQARGGDIYVGSFNPATFGGGGGAGQGTNGSGGGPNGGVQGSSGGNGGFGGGGGQGLGGQAGLGGFGGGGGANFSFFNGSYFYFGGPGSAGGFGGGGGGEGAGSEFGGGIGHANTGGGGSGAGMGGAIFNDAGTVSLINSTLTGNAAAGGLNNANGGTQGSASGGNGSGFGGALFNYTGSLYLTFVTVAGNTVLRGVGGQGGVQEGGGIYSIGDLNCASGGNTCAGTTATLVLVHSIVANNNGNMDLLVNSIYGGDSSGFGKGNLVASSLALNGATLSVDVLSTADPQLGALGANGGFGQTLIPAAGSPAIDLAGDCTDGIGIAVGNDQRGLPRPYGARCDVGAVEVQPLPQIIAFTSSVPYGAVGFTYAVSATGGGSGNPIVFSTAGPCTVSGSTVTFIGTGNCVISADQAGNANYAAATTAQQTIFVTHAQCVVNTTADDAAGASAKVVNPSQYLWNYPGTPFDVTLRDCILAANLMTGASGAPVAADGTPATTPQTDPAMYIFFNANAIGDPTLVLDDELPLIHNNVTIDASTLAQPMTIDGNGHRIFFVSGLPSGDPQTFVNGRADPDGAQPLLVTFDNFVLRNGRAHGGCSGSGGAGMGAGGALFVNRAAQVELIDVSFANNVAQGGDTSGSAENGGSAGGGMGSRSVGGAGGGLGNAGGGDGQNCTAKIAGVDAEDGRGIGTDGVRTSDFSLGGSFGGTGLGQIAATQNFTVPLFGGGSGVVSGNGGSGGIGGGGHYGAGGTAGSGGFGGGGGDGEGVSGGPWRGGDGGFGGGGGYGVGNGGNGGFGGGGGSAAALTAGLGGFGGGGGGTNGAENGSTFVSGGFGGGRGYINGGAGAAFGGAVFVRDGGTLALHATRTQAISGGQVIAGLGKNGFPGGTDVQRGAGSARGEGVFLHGGAAAQFDVDAGATLGIADAITGDCANGNMANLVPPAVCIDGGIAKSGAGTLAMSATSTYNGPTLLAAGILQLDGELRGGTSGTPAPTQPSSVLVDGGTLRGNGYAAGAVTLASGAIAPGNAASPGTLHVGTLGWQSAGTLLLRLGANDAGSDHLLVDGALTKLGNGALRVRFSAGAGTPVPGTVYTLISAGAPGNAGAADFQADPDAPFSGQFTVAGNTVRFTLGALVSDRIFANGFE